MNKFDVGDYVLISDMNSIYKIIEIEKRNQKLDYYHLEDIKMNYTLIAFEQHLTFYKSNRRKKIKNILENV